MIFNIGQSSSARNYNKYIEHWKNAMEEAYMIANRHSFSTGEQNKSRYDLKAKLIDLHPNDRVLVRNLSERGGPGKLKSYWEQDIYRVIRRRDALSPVYEINMRTVQALLESYIEISYYNVTSYQLI